MNTTINYDALDFPVRLHKMRTVPPAGPVPAGAVDIKVPSRRAVVREDTGRVLGVVSNQYALTPHRRVFEPLEAALVAEAPPIRECETRVSRHGAYAKVVWTFDEMMEVGGDPDDRVRLRLEATNSLDRTALLGVALGAYRLICSNGLTVGTGYRETWQHRGDLQPGNAADVVRGLLLRGSDLVHQWSTWREIAYPYSALDQWLAAPGPSQTIGERDRTIVVAYFSDRSPNLWEAYNAITWFATHRAKSRSAETAETRRDAVWDLALRLVSDVSPN